jgi:hypothetical protein
MNRTPDVELVLRDYLADDGLTAPDYILDVVEGRITRQSQRRSWRLQGRPFVNNYLKLAAGLAAVLIVAVVAWQLLPGDGGVGNPPSPVPSRTAAPSQAAAPSLTPIPPLPEGTVTTAGTYRLRPLASAPTLVLDATVPAGWVGGPPCCVGGPVGESNGPNGVAVAFLSAQTIHSDPCHWDQDGNGSAPDEGDVDVGPTVDDLAEALANASYDSTTPVDVTLGGFSGKRLELNLVPDPSGCDTFDGDVDQYFVFGGRDGYVYAQGEGSQWQVSIIDVDGTRLIAALFSYSDTSAADLSAGQAIVDSLVITP